MKRGCRTFQYVLPFVFVWVGLLSYLRVYLYVSCAWCFSSFVRFLRDKIRLIVLLILEIYNVQSQVEIENKSAKASQWTMWWNTKPQMLGQGAQTSSAVLSASVLVLSGVDMGFQVFAPPLKLVARVSPTDIWQNALWVPSWNLFDRPCVCQRYLELVLQVVNQPPRHWLANFLDHWSKSRAIGGNRTNLHYSPDIPGAVVLAKATKRTSQYLEGPRSLLYQLQLEQ